MTKRLVVALYTSLQHPFGAIVEKFVAQISKMMDKMMMMVKGKRLQIYSWIYETRMNNF